MTFGDAAQSDAGKQSSVGGDLLVLLSGMCYAGYTVSFYTLFSRHRTLNICYYIYKIIIK